MTRAIWKARLKRILTRCAWVLGGLAAFVLVTIVAIAALLQTDWGRNQVRLELQDLASERLRGQLRIGSIEGNLLAGFSLRDVQLRDRNGELVVSSSRVAIDYNLAPLLGGEIRIASLLVEEPQIYLAERPNGWNLIQVLPELDDTRPTLKLSIESLEIRRGLVVIDSLSRYEVLRDVNLEAELWIDGATRSASLHRSSARSARWPNVIEFSASIEDSIGLTTIEQASVRSGQSSLTLESLRIVKGEDSNEAAPSTSGRLHADLRASDVQRLTHLAGWQADVVLNASVEQSRHDAPLALELSALAGGAQLDLASEFALAEQSGEFDLHFRKLNPQSLVRDLFSADLSGQLSARFKDGLLWQSTAQATLSAAIEGAIEGRRIDALELDATLQAGSLWSELVLRAPGTNARASSTIDLRSSRLRVERSQLSAVLDLHSLAGLLPESGEMAGTVAIEAQASGPLDALRTTGTGTAHGLRHGQARARSLTFDWRLALGGAVPKGELTLDMLSVHLGREHAQRVSLTLAGQSATAFDATLAVSAIRHSAARIRARVEREAEGFKIRVPRIWLRLGKQIWTGRVDTVYLADSGSVDLRGLRMSSGPAQLAASARWNSRKLSLPNEAELQVQDMDLGLLAQLAGDRVHARELQGSARLSLEIQASKGLHLKAQIDELSRPGKLGNADLSFEFALDKPSHGQWSFRADAGQNGSVRGQGNLDLQRNWRDPGAWQTIDLASFGDVSVDVEDLSMTALGDHLDQDLRGRVHGSFRARKGFGEAELDLHSAALHVPRWTASPVDVNAQLVFKEGRLKADSQVAIAEAGRLRARWEIGLGGHPLTHLTERLVLENLLRVELHADELDLAVLAHPFPTWRDVRGRVSGDLLVEPAVDTATLSLRATDLAFGRFAAGVWHLELDVESDAAGAKLTLQASPDADAFLMADLYLPLTVRALLEGKQAWKHTPLRGRLQVPSVSLRRVRIFAEKRGNDKALPMFAGRLSADFKLGGSADRPTLEGRAGATQLRYGNVALPALAIEARASAQETRLEIELVQPTGQGSLEASLLANWKEERVDAQLRARSFGLSFLNPLLLKARIPIASLSGALAGQGRLRIRGESRELSGRFTLEKGRVSLPQPLDSLHELEAVIDLQSDAIAAKLKGKSRRGSMTVNADLSLVNLVPDKLSASVQIKDLPLSVRGADVIATLKLALDAERLEERWNIKARLDGGDVYLPRIPTSEYLHPIGELQDVAFVSEQNKLMTESTLDPLAWELHLSTGKSMRLHGDDLDVALQLQLDATQTSELVVSGALRVPHGDVTILDRKYHVEEARVELSKDEPRPMLYVRVSRVFPQATVIVTVSGYPDALDLELLARPSIYSHEEILSLIVNGVPSGGNGDRDQAVLSAVAGLATQQLTSRLRDPLGVDSLSVGTAEGGRVSSVAVGKWITTAIFVAYHRSFVADPSKNQDEARMEWWLRGNWILDVRAGDAGAGSTDLLWIFRY